MKSSVAESRGWPSAVACLAILMAGARVYANSLRGPFIFDDLPSIVDNPTIRSLSNIWQVLSPPHGGETVGGRPILNLSFALNYAWTGSQVWSWHAVNIAIHVLTALCLFGIIRRTLALSVPPEQQERHATWPALAVALIWTVHPLATESVTYIVQRAESLAGLFLMLTLYCSIRAATALIPVVQGRLMDCPPEGETPAPQLRTATGVVWQIAAVMACLIGMATKEVMVVAPVLIVLYDWAFLGQTLAKTIKARHRFYAALASTWVLLGILILGSTTRGGSAGFGQGISCWDYLRTQFGFIVLYLKLCFWPRPLVLDYGDQIAPASLAFIPAAGVVLLLAVLTLAALCFKRYRPFGFLGACFFCILAPSSSIVPVVTQTGAEHRMYLPLAAVIALAVIGGGQLWNRVSTKWQPLWQTVPPIAVLALAVLALGSLTLRRNADYRTEASIWTDTAAKCPDNWRVFYCLGCMHYFSGDPANAVEAYNRSVALNSKEFAPLQFRGFSHLKLRKYKEAELDFLRALELNSSDAATHNNLAIARAGAGELEPALASITEAVQLSPANADFRRRRGSLLIRMGRHAPALQECTEAVRLDPRSAEGYQLRGRCYQALKRHGAAIADFTSAIAINPKLASYFLDRAAVLATVKRFDESVGDSSTAIKINPALAAAYQTRAVAYIHLKRYGDARADIAELRRLGSQPDTRILDRLTREEAAADGVAAGVDGQ
jgi:tetratricopeptide (TPR) repeat protein